MHNPVPDQYSSGNSIYDNSSSEFDDDEDQFSQSTE